MAVIHRSAAGARARAGQGATTVLGRAAVPAHRPEAPAPLDAREQLDLDAVLVRAERTWADRLAAEEEALPPEAAAGFADRIGAMVEAEHEGILADLSERLRAHAAPGLGAIKEEVVANAHDYEGWARRVGVLNTAKRAVDDTASLVAHDRAAHDRLLAEGRARLARAPLSDAARAFLEKRLMGELAHAHAIAHIEDDPADARAALTGAMGARSAPYDRLSDEQVQRYAALAETADARRLAQARFVERRSLEARIVAGRAGHEDIEASDLPAVDRLELADLVDRRNSTAAAGTDPFNEFGPDWNPSDPLGLDAVVAQAMDRSVADSTGVLLGAHAVVRRFGGPLREAEIAVFDWAARKVREHPDLISAISAYGDLAAGIPWFFAGLGGGALEVLSLDVGEGERRLSATGFADHLLREFERGVKGVDAVRLSVKEVGEEIEASALEFLERKINDGTIDPDEAAIYVPLVGAIALFGWLRKRAHAGTGNPGRDTAELGEAFERVADAGRLAQIRALIPDYFREMRKASYYPLKREQMQALKDALKRRDFGRPLNRADYTAHKKEWPKNRAKARDDWEAATGLKWPTRERTYFHRGKGEVVTVVIKVDAHHIVPQKNGGPHEWWNIVPVSKDHQRVIHGRDSALTNIQRKEAER